MYSMAYSESRRRSDADTGDGHFFKLIEIPFSSFGDEDEDEDEFNYAGSAVGAARRRSCSTTYGSRRQEYLRSYTFCRAVAKPTIQERMKSRFERLKAAAWATVASSSPYNLPRRVRRIKDSLALRSARHSLYSSQRSRGAGLGSHVPFLRPCFRA